MVLPLSIPSAIKPIRAMAAARLGPLTLRTTFFRTLAAALRKADEACGRAFVESFPLLPATGRKSSSISAVASARSDTGLIGSNGWALLAPGVDVRSER